MEPSADALIAVVEDDDEIRRLVVGLLARARKAQRRLAVCGLSDHYQEIFQITRLVDFMTIYPDETSLVAEVNA